MLDFGDVLTPAGLAALGQVIVIDLMLAGDNVMVLGMLAAGLPARDRRRVLTLGAGLALISLVTFAWLATRLLHVVGLVFAGGLLLLWVAWKLFREIRPSTVRTEDSTVESRERARPSKNFAKAAVQVAIADVSMSLDNVLAVAGAARRHPTVLFFGLALSVTLTVLAANLVARLIERFRWLAYVGLAVVLYVAGTMIHQGIMDPNIGVWTLVR